MPGTPHKQLNIKGMISPVNLLKYQAVVSTLKEGETLEVLLADDTVCRSLTQIIERSTDQILYTRRTGRDICVGIRKGKPPVHRMPGGRQ